MPKKSSIIVTPTDKATVGAAAPTDDVVAGTPVAEPEKATPKDKATAKAAAAEPKEGTPESEVAAEAAETKGAPAAETTDEEVMLTPGTAKGKVGLLKIIDKVVNLFVKPVDRTKENKHTFGDVGKVVTYKPAKETSTAEKSSKEISLYDGNGVPNLMYFNAEKYDGFVFYTPRAFTLKLQKDAPCVIVDNQTEPPTKSTYHKITPFNFNVCLVQEKAGENIKMLRNNVSIKTGKGVYKCELVKDIEFDGENVKEISKFNKNGIATITYNDESVKYIDVLGNSYGKDAKIDGTLAQFLNNEATLSQISKERFDDLKIKSYLYNHVAHMAANTIEVMADKNNVDELGRIKDQVQGSLELIGQRIKDRSNEKAAIESKNKKINNTYEDINNLFDLTK